MFKVCFTKITEIVPHNNADSLEIARVYGFSVVIKKGSYNVGDFALYIPIDSVLPIKLEQVVFGENSKIKLTRGRVKQIRIRQFPSEGMLIDVATVKEYLSKVGVNANIDFKLETNYAELLSVSKYEPPVNTQLISSDEQKAKKMRKGQDNPLFHKYNGLENFKWFTSLFKEDEEVVIQEKLHGCLRNTSSIQLVDGSFRTIQEIVDNKLQVDIWGMNEYGQVVPTRIVNWFNNGSTNEWLKVKYTKVKAGAGNYYRALDVTPNHKFYCPTTGTYVQARDLKPKQKVLFKRYDYDLNYIQEQVLIGKMLGDGSLCRNYIQFGHKQDHSEYVHYTLRSIGDIAGSTDVRISGYGTTMLRGKTISLNSIEDLFSKWYTSENKQFPKNFISKIAPISLAFWYMDDGSLSHQEDQEDRVSIATCGFDQESVDNLLEALKKFDIHGISYSSKSPSSEKMLLRVRLNADEAEKFFLLIHQYIPSCMRYKLPIRYRELPFVELPQKVGLYKPKLVEQEIISVETLDTNRRGFNNNKYDIETTTHNFFVNGVLVHNSNARLSKLPTLCDTLFKKIKKFFGLLPKYEVCYGSNNVDLTNRSNWKGFYGDNVYFKAFQACNAHEKVKENEIIYGEVVGEGIQKNYHYGHRQPHFVLFDVKVYNPDTKEFRWLNPDEVEQYAKERGFDFVPVLYRGVFNKQIAYELTFGDSAYCPEQKIREGVVIKSRFDYNDISMSSNKRALKYISEVYLDKDNSDFH